MTDLNLRILLHLCPVSELQGLFPFGWEISSRDQVYYWCELTAFKGTHQWESCYWDKDEVPRAQEHAMERKNDISSSL